MLDVNVKHRLMGSISSILIIGPQVSASRVHNRGSPRGRIDIGHLGLHRVPTDCTALVRQSTM